MNLIKELGGYKTLKREYEETLPLIQKGYKSKSMEVIRLILLEYRRQHNIFEVGDYYAYLYEWDSDLDIVCKYNPSEWSDHLWNIKNMIRHATDAEIKTGHRISHATDNLSHFDHCSDIANHISPNTKVFER